ncbi:MAG: hypothetical protein Q8S18_05180 [Bacteroidales bacterium]|nr:hypothetical protein [Bacteroidales bacterium]
MKLNIYHLLIIIFFTSGSISEAIADSLSKNISITTDSTIISQDISEQNSPSSLSNNSYNSDNSNNKIDYTILLATLTLILGIIYKITPWFWKRYVKRPELIIELVPTGGVYKKVGLSSKNDFSKKYDVDTSIDKWELIWNYRLIIRNNTDMTAFYPKLKRYVFGVWFSKIELLNDLKPIKSTDKEISLSCEFVRYDECLTSTIPQLGKGPIEFQDLKILLWYKNSANIPFYTLFEFKDFKSKNRFSRIKPKGYE